MSASNHPSSILFAQVQIETLSRQLIRYIEVPILKEDCIRNIKYWRGVLNERITIRLFNLKVSDEITKQLTKYIESKLSNNKEIDIRCKICGALYKSHEIIGGNNKRGHRINSELAKLNGVEYLAGVFHWYEPLPIEELTK